MGRGGGCGQRRRHARVHRAEVGARLDIKASGGRHSPEIYPLTAKRRFASTVQTERAHCACNARHGPQHPRIVASFGSRAEVISLSPIAEQRSPHSVTILFEARHTSIQSAAHAVFKANISSRSRYVDRWPTSSNFCHAGGADRTNFICSLE